MKIIKNHFNKFIFSILAPLAISGVEYNSDISISGGSPNFFHSSCIKFSGTLFDYFDHDQRAWLLSPKISYFLSGQSAFTMAAGLRHDIHSVSLGNHVFFNVINDKKNSFYQFGKSFDLIHDKWEAHVNYYFPSKVKMPHIFMLYETASMIEGEFLFKTPFIHLGFNNLFNFKSNNNCISFKIILPFNHFSIGSNISVQKDAPLNMAVSITYNFLDSEKCDKKSNNAIYRDVPKFEKRPMIKRQKLEENIKNPVADPNTASTQVPEVPEPVAPVSEEKPSEPVKIEEPVTPIPDQPPNDSSWWRWWKWDYNPSSSLNWDYGSWNGPSYSDSEYSGAPSSASVDVSGPSGDISGPSLPEVGSSDSSYSSSSSGGSDGSSFSVEWEAVNE